MPEKQDSDVLAVMSVTLRRDQSVAFETIEDEIVGRGLIDALRAHFDQKMSKKNFEQTLRAQQIRAMQSQLKNGGRG